MYRCIPALLLIFFPFLKNLICSADCVGGPRLAYDYDVRRRRR